MSRPPSLRLMEDPEPVESVVPDAPVLLALDVWLLESPPVVQLSEPRLLESPSKTALLEPQWSFQPMAQAMCSASRLVSLFAISIQPSKHRPRVDDCAELLAQAKASLNVTVVLEPIDSQLLDPMESPGLLFDELMQPLPLSPVGRATGLVHLQS